MNTKTLIFTDDQIDLILRLVNNKAFQVSHTPHLNPEDLGYDYEGLANHIRQQIEG